MLSFCNLVTSDLSSSAFASNLLILDSTSDYFGRGLRQLGLQPREKLCVFADTRAEWMITAQACFKQAFPIATLYTNLGEEAVVHGLNQTQVTPAFYIN